MDLGFPGSIQLPSRPKTCISKGWVDLQQGMMVKACSKQGTWTEHPPLGCSVRACPFSSARMSHARGCPTCFLGKETRTWGTCGFVWICTDCCRYYHGGGQHHVQTFRSTKRNSISRCSEAELMNSTFVKEMTPIRCLPNHVANDGAACPPKDVFAVP